MMSTGLSHNTARVATPSLERRRNRSDRRVTPRGGRRAADLACVGMMAGVISLLPSSWVAAQEERDLLIPPGTGTAWHGVYLPYNTTITASDVTTFEGEANKPIGTLLLYVGWYENVWAHVQQQLSVVDPMGIKVMVTWEPNLSSGGDPLAAILNGSQDAIIDDFATKSKAWGKPFFFRFGHEMNGNWYSWSGAKTGRDPQKYIWAWQYVWNRFQAAGNDNAVWVWSPNVDSVPNEPWNDLDNYYPGGAYVDWVGVDFYGLMWGDQLPGRAIDKVYADYGSIKPIMISETAAADCTNYAPNVTVSKDQWITRLFSEMAVRPNVRAFFWFNTNKEADWRITSCVAPASQDAYRAGVGSSKYVTRADSVGPPPPPEAAPPVTVLSPTEGAALAGVHPFQGVVENMPLSSYRMYWQIPGDPLNLMSDSLVGTPHKEALVDVSTWTWLGRGPYTLNFVAQDLNGTTFAEKRVDIYVNQGPISPTALTATAASASLINLTWKDNASNENGFKIERCLGSGCANFVQVAQVGANVTIYGNTGLASATTYTYRIRATNGSGDSGYSNVVSAATPAAPVVPPTTGVSIWWPSAGTPVSGTSAFMARLEGRSLSAYKMYWQVDGDRLNVMYDSTVGGDHKEALVNVAGWTWRGDGPYVINFVAKDSTGTKLGEKRVTIYIAR